MISRTLLTLSTLIVCTILGLLLTEQMQGSGGLPGRQVSGFYDFAIPANRLRDRIDSGLQHNPPQVNAAEVRALAVAAPLDALSYVAGLPESISAEDGARTEAITGHILRLTPRNLAAWRARLYIASKADEPDRMIEALSRLYVLDPERRARYVNALAEIGMDASGQAYFLDAISHHPPWGRVASLQIIAESDDDKFLLTLVNAYPDNQSQYLERLTNEGDWTGAYIAFLSILAPEARTDLASPFDPAFLGSPAPRPFNWLLNNTYTSLEPRGGLSARFPGASQVWLSKQAIALSPGNYTLSTSMSGHTVPEGGYFRWEVACIAGKRLTYLNVTDLLSIRHNYIKQFAVPHGEECDFQYLVLFGMGGKFPRSAQAMIHDVSITSAAKRTY
jgi:hypothetical protein